jgi:cation diffusion facilitator CzcD-associated flavoprotein CzcO
LHQPQNPAIEGIENFGGRAFHSARWEHDYDFTGKTVAVVGTGPSAVQFVPVLAGQVKQLVLYQRSPGWCIPKFDRAYTAPERWLLRNVPLVHDLDRGRVFWFIEYLASALQNKSRINFLSKAIFGISSKLLLRLQVRSAALRAKLTPDSPVGCKRTLLSNEWLRTLARPNVEVVTEAITGATATGLCSADGQERKVDAIVYGTGFASTRFLSPMRISGIGGATLDDCWEHRAAAYLGVTVSGFPNLFIVYGPNTNLGAGSIIYMLERQQQYIAQAVKLLRERGLRYLDVRPEAQDAFIREVDERSGSLAYTAGCQNWYLTNGLNTNNWVGYMNEYGRRLRHFREADYRVVAAVPAGEVGATA